MYRQMIREDMAKLGRIGAHDPALVEAWMRLEHGCLDGLSAAQFKREVAAALECCDADPAASVRLAESFGLAVAS